MRNINELIGIVRGLLLARCDSYKEASSSSAMLYELTGKEMVVFKAVKMLIFESDELDAIFEIIQDGVPRRLTDYRYKVTARER